MRLVSSRHVLSLLGLLALSVTLVGCPEKGGAPADIGGLVKLIEDGVISSKIARTVFDHMWAGEGSPETIVEKHGLVQVTDTGALEASVDALIAANPDKAAAVREKPQAIGWFVGQVMKETGGKANPAAVNEILKRKLGL